MEKEVTQRNNSRNKLRRKGNREGFLRRKKEENVILIDGENFVHKLVENLRRQGLLKSRSDLTKVDMLQLMSFAKKPTINYYSTTVRVSSESELFDKAQELMEWNEKWTPQLVAQGVNIIKAGYLRGRDGKTCPNCGVKSEILLEKGVDVRIAVDIIWLANKKHHIYVLSSDTDLMPAIERAVSTGCAVTYVAFPGETVESMERMASETILLTDEQIKKAFREAK